MTQRADERVGDEARGVRECADPGEDEWRVRWPRGAGRRLLGGLARDAFAGVGPVNHVPDCSACPLPALAYNLKRVLNIVGVPQLLAALA